MKTIMKNLVKRHHVRKRINNFLAGKHRAHFLGAPFQKAGNVSPKPYISPMPIIKVQERTAARIASLLLQIEAIKLNVERPFTWASGWKSPIYCDNRLSLSYPDIRREIKEGLVSAIRENYFTAEVIAGVATAGIPQAALVAEAMNLPMIYVRSKPKDHGMENLVEGRIVKGHRAVVVEDLVSTGSSSLRAVQALRERGIQVIGMVSVFNYGFDVASKNFYEADTSLICLSDYSHLLRYAIDQKYITQEQLVSLKAWRVDPANWRR
jgi:orotate phosphoribosyltransferase